MKDENYQQFAEAWLATNKIYNLEIQENVLEIVFVALKDCDIEEIKMALSQHIKESPYPPKPVDIRSRLKIKSLHPKPEEAWGLALPAQNEDNSIVWTNEISEAFGACREQLNAGDVVGSRMAFLEKYRTLIEEADRENRHPFWWSSFGFNKETHQEAQTKAKQLNEQIKLVMLPESKIKHLTSG